MAKILSLGKFAGNITLTPLMIQTLRAACKMQSADIPFSQNNLNGSFTALLKRGCIDSKPVFVNEIKEIVWFVTQRGIKALDKLGYDEPC